MMTNFSGHSKVMSSLHDFVTGRKTRDTTDSMAVAWMNVNWDVICSSPTKKAP